MQYFRSISSRESSPSLHPKHLPEIPGRVSSLIGRRVTSLSGAYRRVSTKYRCHSLCHLEMSLPSGSGRRAARSPGVAQRPTCVAITEGDRRPPCPCLPCSRKYPIRGRSPAKCSCYSKRHYQGMLWLPWTSTCYRFGFRRSCKGEEIWASHLAD
jgi:hypothetical protein